MVVVVVLHDEPRRVADHFEDAKPVVRPARHQPLAVRRKGHAFWLAEARRTVHGFGEALAGREPPQTDLGVAAERGEVTAVRGDGQAVEAVLVSTGQVELLAGPDALAAHLADAGKARERPAVGPERQAGPGVEFRPGLVVPGPRPGLAHVLAVPGIGHAEVAVGSGRSKEKAVAGEGDVINTAQLPRAGRLDGHGPGRDPQVAQRHQGMAVVLP